MKLAHIVIAFILPLLAVGCSDPEEARLVLSVSTVRDVFGNGMEARADVSIWNRGTRIARIPRCGDIISPELQRRVDGEWESAGGGPICPANVPMVPLDLAPGEEAETAAFIPEAGTYRVVLQYTIPPNDQEWHVARSAPFTVE